LSSQLHHFKTLHNKKINLARHGVRNATTPTLPHPHPSTHPHTTQRTEGPTLTLTFANVSPFGF